MGNVQTSHLASFRNFYKQLANKECIFYIFFTQGLLFWLANAMSFIPDQVNVVLIGAGLDKEEVLWVKKRYHRPFWVVDEYIDDRAVWQILFACNYQNFGWIDVDCFVFNHELFNEISQIQDNVSFNSIWSWKCQTNITFTSTYMLYVNVPIIKQVNENVPVTPMNYCYPGSDPLKNQNAWILSQRQMDFIDGLLTPGEYPVPQGFDHGLPFFDTLLLYQLIAHKCGFEIHKTRNLSHSKYFSNEIIHIGDASYFSNLKNSFPKFVGENLNIFLKISYLILNKYKNCLPAAYVEKSKLLALLIQSQFGKLCNIRQEVEDFFIKQGIRQQTVSRLLDKRDNYE